MNTRTVREVEGWAIVVNDQPYLPPRGQYWGACDHAAHVFETAADATHAMQLVDPSARPHARVVKVRLRTEE